jgi:hypothetical protein
MNGLRILSRNTFIFPHPAVIQGSFSKIKLWRHFIFDLKEKIAFLPK